MVGERILALQDDLILAREELRFRATHDVLTGISNRAAVMDALRNEFSRQVREQRSFGVILVDIDHFKNVNDTYGHLCGDEVLQVATRRMKECMRPYDTVGRYGGEEFLIIASAADARGTMALAERIRGVIESKPVITQGGEVRVTASLGAAVSTSRRRRSSDAAATGGPCALFREGQRPESLRAGSSGGVGDSSSRCGSDRRSSSQIRQSLIPPLSLFLPSTRKRARFRASLAAAQRAVDNPGRQGPRAFFGPSALVATATRSDDGINQIVRKTLETLRGKTSPGKMRFFEDRKRVESVQRNEIDGPYCGKYRGRARYIVPYHLVDTAFFCGCLLHSMYGRHALLAYALRCTVFGVTSPREAENPCH